MGCSVVPISMLVLAFMPSWSLCLSPDPGAVSGQVVDASVEPCFMQAGSEDVSKNQFYLGVLLAGFCSLWTCDWLGVLSLLCRFDVDASLWLCPRLSVWVLPC